MLEKIYESFSSFPYTEVRWHRNYHHFLSFLNGRLTSSIKFTNEGYSVRYYKDGVLYFLSAYTPEELRPTGSYSVKGWEVGYDDTQPKGGKYEAKEKKPLDSMSIDEKIKYFKEVYNAIKDNPSLVSFSIFYNENIEEKEVLVNNVKVQGRVPRVYVGISMVVKENNRTATARYEIGGSGGLEVLEGSRLQEFVQEKLKAVEEVLKKGKPFGEKKTDVVLSGMLAGIMAHESVGHPFEGDRILGREFAQAGLSYLAEIKEGKIGSDVVNVVDDPTVEGGSGYYKIDDEGVEARPKYMIKNGYINELLHDRFSAVKFNAKSNGSARASDFDREPLVRMSNTFFKPGDMKFEELLEDVKEGVFIKTYMEWNIDDLRLGQRYVGLEAYEIKNGEIGDPVLFPVLQGKTPELLSSIDAVDNTLSFYPGTCGKGDPDQGIPVWLGGPDMRLRNVRIKEVIGNE
ncbi:MAG: TldD/PmbA family protein [Sulfolobaceae archaeon]|nr:TldD/PmbA family protein [Sulfolobaceae archaeon]